MKYAVKGLKLHLLLKAIFEFNKIRAAFIWFSPGGKETEKAKELTVIRTKALEFMTLRHISRVKRESLATALAQFPPWLRPKFQITPQLVPRISCLRGESTRDSVDPASFPEEKVFLWEIPRAGYPNLIA